MKYTKELVAILIFVTGFFLILFNPIKATFEMKSLIGIGLIILFGALLTIGGMIKVPKFYMFSLLALSFFSISAIGLFIFAFFGLSLVTSEEENLIKPKTRHLSQAAFSAYSIFVLISILVIYPSLKFTIPPVISGFAVKMLVPAIGCELDYTGQECIDLKVSELILDQCNGNADCITGLNNERAAIEDQFYQQFENQFNGFTKEGTIKQTLTAVLENEVNRLIEPYEWIFKLIMAFIIFSVFQLMGKLFSGLAAILSFILLKIFETSLIIEKRKISVEKTIFST